MGYDHEKTSITTSSVVLLTVEQLALCLHKSVASIRSDATRNPCSLPPICRLPGTKRLLWLAEHVISQGLDDRAVKSADMPRRGRPTKAEQLARQKSQNSNAKR